jgi:AmmeMemoRadiSam system protein B
MAAASIRPAAVAGSFYPASPRTLRAEVEKHLAAAAPAPGRPPKAVIAPHAGYVYSGATAGFAFAALAAGAGSLRRIVLLGPAHRVWLRGLGLPGAAGFETPLGTVAVDQEAVAAVADLPQVAVHRAAHAQEHSLEVELPFLQVALGAVAVLPLVVGEASGEEVAEVLDRVWGGPETAVVVSSDLSHYLPYETARQVDRATADEIVRLGGPLDPRQACGALPINGLLIAARRRGLAATLLDLRSSGDAPAASAGGAGRDQVVGYGAFAFQDLSG